MGTVLILVYMALAIYSGFNFLSGRSEWLDRQAPLNIVCKIIMGVVVGYFIAAFYLIYLIFKLLRFVFRM